MILVLLPLGYLQAATSRDQIHRLNLVVLQSPGAKILVLLKVLRMDPHRAAMIRDHNRCRLRPLSLVVLQCPGVRILVLHKVLRLVPHQAVRIRAQDR